MPRTFEVAQMQVGDDQDLRRRPTPLVSPRTLWPLAVMAFILVANARAPSSIHPLLKAGAFDEACHLATGVLLVAALRPRVNRSFMLAALAASVLIDLDHVPGTLGGHWLTHGTPRPYTHSLLALAAIGMAALIWRGQRAAAAGAFAGIAFHFARDLAEPQASGVSLLWPFTNHAFSLPRGVYVALIGALAVAGVQQSSRRARQGQFLRRRTDNQSEMPSDLLHGHLLGSDAVYSVVSHSRGHVLVEVVEAPGLPKGFRFRMTAAAYAQLDPVAAVRPPTGRFERTAQQ